MSPRERGSHAPRCRIDQGDLVVEAPADDEGRTVGRERDSRGLQERSTDAAHVAGEQLGSGYRVGREVDAPHTITARNDGDVGEISRRRNFDLGAARRDRNVRRSQCRKVDDRHERRVEVRDDGLGTIGGDRHSARTIARLNDTEERAAREIEDARVVRERS